MGALTGIWHTYSQNVAKHAIFEPEMRVEIDDQDKATFELIEIGSEAVAFKKGSGQLHGRPVYLGKSKSYRYWAQIHKNNGRELLVGYAFTKGNGPYALPEYRSVFVGLREPKGPVQNFAELEIPFHGHSYPKRTLLYSDGSLHISRPNKTILLKLKGVPAAISHHITEEKEDSIGWHFVAEIFDREDPIRPVLINQLKALIIFDRDSCPIFIGYHWRPTAEISYEAGAGVIPIHRPGPAGSPICTLVATGSCDMTTQA